jgi:hypothetical protein
MNTLTGTHPAQAWTRAARQLSGIEARRMLRHPAYPAATLYIAVFIVSAITQQTTGPPGNFIYQSVLFVMLVAYAPVTLVAANRVAAQTYKNRVRGPFDAAPVDSRQRTVAAILGLLRGPVAAGLIGVPVLLILDQFTSTATTDAVYQRTAVEYLDLPGLVLGAGLLGIAVARWLPQPGALPLTAVVLWLGTVAMYRPSNADLAHGSTWFTLWPVWFAKPDGNQLPRQPFDQESWHLTYLFALGVLAGIAALLRTDGPRRALWATAAVTVGVGALASWQQLG